MIERFGWSDHFAKAFEDKYARSGFIAGRVVLQQRGSYTVVTEDGPVTARPTGRLLHEADDIGQPCVGDWVALLMDEQAGIGTVQAILPRKSALVRRAIEDASRATQIIAANVDVAFIVTSLNADMNPRRIQRYLAAVRQSGARPVVVLTKADLVEDADDRIAEIKELDSGIAVVPVSARTGEGLDDFLSHVQLGQTCVLIGSSGVGKSTLVNTLLDEDRMVTREVRETDDQGRHTTSHRELIVLPSGGMLIDTPGIREVGLLDNEEGVAEVFDDVEELMTQCKFSNCSHVSEPGCAVQAAMKSGELTQDRWTHFVQLRLEMAEAKEKIDRVARDAEKRRLAASQKHYRATKRNYRGSKE
ncbi:MULTISPECIES: ribosome small subunit-dependent GTPase A [unclassified Brevundimonas]|uniref:ribosome small subunit-dependent GTPase A n=1 Tax=unclassified Brevundimonas TaxID=2622653 RepID=UPI0025C3FA24|nr:MULTISPECIES: ribosome small subunit-dependent GTPase A [unclassified Brevundimonas]